MGLDNCARRASGEEPTGEDIAAFEEEGPNLCGGIVSGDAGSFRGKVYAGLVDAVTGESLYEEFTPPEGVKAMYEALRHRDPDEIDYCDYRFGDPKEQISELRKVLHGLRRTQTRNRELVVR
jgi:hypothetical protein